jgi:DNA-binding GntR family transcriptional regulator
MPIPRTPDPLPAPPLRRQEAERRLRSAIARGELAPGERITEDELAAWLGVSRTPVREALSRLAAAGLVTLDANRGARVTPLDPAEMLDLVQVSRGLVLLAQRQATERATDEDLRAIRGHHEQRAAAQQAGDAPGVERSALAFHMTILGASRNHDLQRVYAMVFSRLERVFRVAYPEWLLDAGVELDGAILEAMEARDPDAVVAVSATGWDTLEAGIRIRAAELAAQAAAAAEDRVARPAVRAPTDGRAGP